MFTAEGNGPVNAIDTALRRAVQRAYPHLANVHLTDYKVRILDGGDATGAVTRVLLSATDGVNDWTTIGVSPNIIEASWRALEEGLVYGTARAVTEFVEAAGKEASAKRARARTVVGFAADYFRATMRALGIILETRLRELLREDLGGTYGVSVAP